jgi:hypothetical protein
VVSLTPLLLVLCFGYAYYNAKLLFLFILNPGIILLSHIHGVCISFSNNKCLRLVIMAVFHVMYVFFVINRFEGI